MTAGVTQCAVLDRIGGEFVDRQRQRQGLPGSDDKRGAGNRKSAVAGPVRCQRGPDHVIERSFGPVGCRHQIVRSPERGKPCLIFFQRGAARRVLEGLGSHRTQDCQRILDDSILQIRLTQFAAQPFIVADFYSLEPDKQRVG